MIKLIVFDLDGVLMDAKEIHYEALNDALQEQYKIRWDEHIRIYDGLKTKEKLLMLTKSKGLPIDLHEQVWQNKQKNTLNKLQNIKSNTKLCNIIKTLIENNYYIAVCSNSIR